VKEHINENLKDELIDELMRISNKYTLEYKQYLQNLSEEELDKMVGDYYLYDIQRKTKHK